MINVSKLYTQIESESDSLRYGEISSPSSSPIRKPVVVWTIGRRCNLHCIHCYSDSQDKSYDDELTFDEACSMLRDLGAFKIPALLMSGGEPLMRERFFDLAKAASNCGIRLTLSTNGTLIDKNAALLIRKIGFSYVGISFDGLGETNDMFRGKRGAFDAALSGLRNLKSIGQKVGLRFTLTKRNFKALSDIFAFVEKEEIDRVCFYHLVYSGRGSRIKEDDLSAIQSREALDKICAWALDLKNRGKKSEVLTVDNHADGPYIYMKLLRENPGQAKEALRLLEANGGALGSSGVGISNVDSYGRVHPDQFWQSYSLGNVKEKPFSEIWQRTDDPILNGLRDRLPLLKGRCRSCKWKKICGGSFRARALLAFNDPWQEDPACYLTNEETSEK